MLDFPKTLFNANELMTVSSGIRNAVSGISQDTTVQRLLALINVDEAELKSAMSKGRSSKYSSTIEILEESCDNSYCTFRNLSKTCAEQTDDQQVAEAATVIVTILRNTNWNLHKLGYKKQLVELKALDAKLSAPAAVLAMESAGLKKWYDNLCAATVKLGDIADLRVDEVNDNDLPLIKESSVRLYGHLLKLYNHIDTNEELVPEVYLPVARAIDAVLSTVIPEARQRKTKNMGKKTVLQ